MTIPDYFQKEFDKPFNFKYFLYLFSVIFIFDLTYPGSYYIILIFILFLFEISGPRFREIYIPDLIQWIFLLIWGAFEVTQSIVKTEAFYYYYIIILLPFLIFIIFNNTKLNLKDLDNFFIILFGTGIILTFFSFLILINSNFDFKFRIPSTWAHYNLVAAYFMVLLMFNLSFLVNSHNSPKKIFYIISFIVILMGLFMTQTRGIWLSTVIGIMFYIFRKPKLIFPILLVFSVLMILFYGIIMDRFFSAVNFGNDLSSLGRIQAWYASAVLIKNNFLIGYGFDSFRYLRDSVITAFFVVLPHPHNTYLTLILDIGFIGFVLYISFFFKAFYYSLKLRKKTNNPEFNKFLDGLQLSFVGFIVAFMFEPYFTVLGAINYMLWILIALSYYLKNHFEDEFSLHLIQN